MKKLLALTLIAAAGASLLQADVIRMRDGGILLGKVTGNQAGVTIIELGDEKKIVPQADILATEPDLTALKAQKVEVLLKDGSMLTGTIKDFDQDVGLLLDIEFGSLTLPFSSVSLISDPVQRGRFKGFPITLGLTGGYYFPVGDDSADFSGNFDVALSAEFDPNLFRGFFIGAGLSYVHVSYIPNSSLSYLVFNAQALASYRFLQLRASDTFLKALVPFVTVGAGGAYVNTYDSRAGYETSARNDVSFSFSGTAGFDYYVADRILIRLSGTWLSIFQDTSLFNTLSVNLGAAVSF